jgi:hypothetical protein
VPALRLALSRNVAAIEIFNPAGASVDLAAGGYSLFAYFNGNDPRGPALARRVQRTAEDLLG